MTVDEVFKSLSNHMVKGMMFHDQMTSYYSFLNLKGYKRCHEYHFFMESLAYVNLCKFYMKSYHKLIPTSIIENPHAIPDSWYNYSQEDVDVNTKRSSTKQGNEKWKEWEKDTRDLYKSMYIELIQLDEIESAMYVRKLLHDVEGELHKVTKLLLDEKAIDYDLGVIVTWQQEFHDKYKCKLEEMWD